jgi:hypothetical protein
VGENALAPRAKRVQFEAGGPTVKSPVANLTLAVALLASVGGCKRTNSGAAFPRDWSANPPVAVVPGTQEIYALSDVHGDPDVTFRLLAAAGLMTTTEPLAWSGGDKILVVVGDVIDKGSSALPVIDLLMTLEPQARAAGGRVVVTLGNHEAEFLADPADPKSAVFQAELLAAGLDPAAVAAGEGPYGAWLNNLPVAALLGDWFFCHSGDSEGRSATSIGNKFRNAVQGPDGYGDDFLIGMGSILEANVWWNQPGGAVPTLDAYLAALPAKHIVMGHEPGVVAFPGDPQGQRQEGELAERHDGRLFLIDVGMSYAVGESTGALLRIKRTPVPATSTVFVDGTETPLWP